MSSTNRSSARDFHIADYYVTPHEPIRKFLREFCRDEQINLENISILDPCAGWDAKNKMSYPSVLEEFWAKNILTNDIREDSLSEIKQDFIKMGTEKKFDLIITNPPFWIAIDIIKKSLELCEEGGYVVMLLRLNYFWGKLREDFWKKNMPVRAYVHNKRMGFAEKWWTDSIEYMHCVWKKWENPKNTKLSILFE